MRLRIRILLLLVVYSLPLLLLGCATGQRRAQHLRQLFEMVKTAKEEKQLELAKAELNQVTPKYKEEIKILSVEMEASAYMQAQEVASKAESKSLVPELLRAYAEEMKQFKIWFEEQMRSQINGAEVKGSSQTKKVTEAQEPQRRLGNVETLIRLFGRMKDARTIAALKEALNYEPLRYEASTALGQIGDEKTLNELMARVEKEREINVSSFGDKALKRIVDEINDPNTAPRRRAALTEQLPASNRLEVVSVLKDLALKSLYEDVREHAGLALVNSMLLDEKVMDIEFLMKWVQQEQGFGKTWAVDAIRLRWDDRYIPVLIELLKDKRWENVRSKAARLLGDHNAVEAIPALEEALRGDRDRSVRSTACSALEKLTGKIYYIEVYESDFKNDPVYLQRIKIGELPAYKIIGVQRP